MAATSHCLKESLFEAAAAVGAVVVLEVGLGLRIIFKGIISDFFLGLVSVSDWKDSIFHPDRSRLSLNCNNTIITESNPAAAVRNPAGDTQSDTLPPYSLFSYFTILKQTARKAARW